MLQSVTASAPGKLMLFGEHSVVHGHPCIVTAVNQRLSVRVEKNGENLFSLHAPDLQLHAYSKTIEDLGNKPPKQVRFVETLYKSFLEKYPQKETIHVMTKSDFSSKFGFGSSSAVTVAFAKALTQFYEMNLTNQELFDLCYAAVIEVQGVGSGFDLAAAIWGGTLYYVSPAKVVKSLNIDRLPIVVGYTGIKADTPTLIRMVENLKANKENNVDGIFDQITDVVEQAADLIKNNLWPELGELMTSNQKLLRKLRVSSVELERLISAAQDGGAYGAKLSGAGGGDCMIALVNSANKKKVTKSIGSAGGEVLPVELNAQGVRIEA
jgi:mevalonate kinase